MTYIVAEISKNWHSDGEPVVDTPILAEQFATVLRDNLARGYRLHSWKLSRVPCFGRLNETIIAVFQSVSSE